MNKALYVFVYVFLILSGAALFFEIELNGKRAELTDRNRMQEDYLVRIAKTIEKAEPDKNSTFEIQKDASAVENKDIAPEMENILEEYPAPLEQSNLETYNWENSRDQLRSVYVIDPMTGKPVMDGNQPQTRGSDEQKMLEQLFGSAKEQQTRLNNTRAQLTEMRARLESVVNELNKLKPEARKDKVTIDDRNAKIAKLEEAKTQLEDSIKKLKAQIDELNGEITSLRDEVQTAKNETEAAKEELAKEQKKTEQLKMLVKELIAEANARSAKGGRAAVTSITNGDKGKVVHCDNKFMFAIVEFSDEAIKELKGEDFSRPLPILELSVRREGFKGQAGEFIGRIRLRQEVKGKNFIICDILGEWEQAKLQKGDIVVAD
jgi:outer membrane murein-binding lipoprotein Lpp